MPPKKPVAASPLESAKISAPPSVVIPPPPPPPAAAAPADAPPPAPPKPAELTKYRVKAATTISLFGQIIHLPADAIISAEGYGPEGMNRILASNVPLEKLS